MDFRIGFGFDTHRLEEGRDLLIGGIRIPHEKGAAGHSDADVLIHALCDALLGAAGLRDIGHQFPDTSEEFRGINSGILLERTLGMIREKGFRISNLDSTVVLQNPKIGKFIPDMVEHLSRLLEIGQDRVSVKAKTGEKLGFIGREEGVSAYAVALLLHD
ncbi:MAG TPA: 2-C-methyl-D-erythritol 2,4-cyclodiphosphate synthase [Bacteroidales bacterium]|nr:2-C-methyl-D-erythritol 2,4-cyclodiphosphate synthase [Bacteroidales bacterium]